MAKIITLELLEDFATKFANKITTLFVKKESGKGLSSNDYTAAEKEKLSGIADNANNYTHPGYTAKESGLYKVTVDVSGHVSAVAAVTKTDITDLGIPAQDTNTTYTNMSGASASNAGQAGLVPAPPVGKQDAFLRGDGTWADIPKGTTVEEATTGDIDNIIAGTFT